VQARPLGEESGEETTEALIGSVLSMVQKLGSHPDSALMVQNAYNTLNT